MGIQPTQKSAKRLPDTVVLPFFFLAGPYPAVSPSAKSVIGSIEASGEITAGLAPLRHRPFSPSAFGGQRHPSVF